MEHFNIGDKVIVVKNTERIPEEARLGEHGKIVGFKSNDCIVEFDGKKVTTYKSFLTELYSKEPGDKVELVINRNGQERKVSVVLGEQ